MEHADQCIYCRRAFKRSKLLRVQFRLNGVHYPLGKDSRTFDKVAVRDIGRRSTRISLTGHVLGTGMTFASFHWYGTHACLMEALKVIDTGSASSNEKVLRNQFGKESGPRDLLDLTALSRGSTSAAEMKYDIEGFSIGCLSRGVRGGIISVNFNRTE